MKIYEAKLTFEMKEDGPVVQVNTPELVVRYLTDVFAQYPEQESFWVIALNRKNYAKGRCMISLGTATSCLAHPREIFRFLVLAGATGFIVAHNHPSGDPSPSAADTQLTRQIREAAKCMDIDFLDHVIVGAVDCDPNKTGFYSFRNASSLLFQAGII